MGLANLFGATKEPKYSSVERDFLQNFGKWLGYSKSYSRHIRDIRDIDRSWDRYLGRHYNSLLTPYLPFKSRPAYNHNARIIETLLPILTDSRPIMQAQARKPDEEDFARALDAVLAYQWERNNMDMKLVEALKGTLIAGTTFFKVYYDPFIGGKSQGDICIDIVPMHMLYTDPDCPTSDLDMSRYVILEVPVDPYQMQARFQDVDFGDYGEDDDNKTYGSDVGGPVPPSIINDSDNKPGIFWGSGRYKSGLKDDKSGDSYYECWFRTPDSPLGKVAIVYKNRLLKYKGSDVNIMDNPNPEGFFPFVKMVDKEVPGCIFGKSTSQDNNSLHDEYNYRMGQIIDHANLVADPEKIVPQTAGMTDREIKYKFPGKIMRPATVEDAKGISYLVPPPLSETVFQLLNITRQNMDDIAGTHETIQGQRAEATVSGRAQAVLQEAALVRVRLQQRNMENALARIGQRAIALVLEYYNEERIVRTSTEEGGMAFHQIVPKTEYAMNDKGELERKGKRFFIANHSKRVPKLDDKGNHIMEPVTGEDGQPVHDPNGSPMQSKAYDYEGSYVVSTLNPSVDVRVVTGSSLPVSQAARFQQLLDLLQARDGFGEPVILAKNIRQALPWMDAQKVAADVEKATQEHSKSGPPAPEIKMIVNAPADKVSPQTIVQDIQAISQAQTPQPQAGA